MVSYLVMSVRTSYQPLYVIPALSVVGMKLKDVWGFMAFMCVFWVVITCLGLYFIMFI